MSYLSRREFLSSSALAMAAGGAASLQAARLSAAEGSSDMQFGLVTYLWGRDWDLPTLIRNCEATDVLGVELRTEHAHGVEPSLSASERQEVRQRFADSPVICLGPGTNQQFDDPDPAKLRANIEGAKAFIRLSHDIGGTGVKVKPNSFHRDVSREQTIEQIGRSLNDVGKFAADFGQQIRLEVHGTCAELPTIHAIMEIADHPSVAVCWNSNQEDLSGAGIEENFRMVRSRFGDTVHVRELDGSEYPYQTLMNLLVGTNYTGWILLEARTEPEDRVVALRSQRVLFETMVAQARA